MICATNSIGALSMSLRKTTRNRDSFPSERALLKLLYLALQNIGKKWTMPIRDWKAALNRFTVQSEDRSRSINEFRLHKILDTFEMQYRFNRRF